MQTNSTVIQLHPKRCFLCGEFLNSAHRLSMAGHAGFIANSKLPSASLRKSSSLLMRLQPVSCNNRCKRCNTCSSRFSSRHLCSRCRRALPSHRSSLRQARILSMEAFSSLVCRRVGNNVVVFRSLVCGRPSRHNHNNWLSNLSRRGCSSRGKQPISSPSKMLL